MITLVLVLQATVPGPVAAARVDPLLARTPVPREGAVAVLTSSSADAVYVGDQLEVLTSAWFPAVIRQRLRRPPVLRPPSLSGVYGLPVLTLPGVSAIRTVGGTTYDIFASHQVVFPLAPGQLQVPAAELGFSLPGGRLFFADDQSEERRSPIRSVQVRALPESGRPDAFTGAVARELRLGWRLASPAVRAGELIEADLLLGGTGNLPLWPAPPVVWAPDLRVYPDRVDESIEWRGGRFGGIRRIRYLILADSIGSITLPPVRYNYFDPGSGRYHMATAAPVVVPVLPAATLDGTRTPPAWVTERPVAWSRRLTTDFRAVVAIVTLLAPAAALFLRARKRPKRREGAQLEGGAELFERALAALVGPQQTWDSTSLAGHLRRAGIDRAEAEKAVAIHARLRRARFAAHSATDVEAGRLGRAWVENLPARLRHSAALVLLLLLGGVPLAASLAQRPEPAALYREGAWEAAAQAQQAALATDPGTATRWHNLAAALWTSGQDGPAAAALLEAYRLSPRDPAIRRLWGTMSLQHQQLRPLAPPVPVTPDELVVTGVLLWILAWVLVAFRRERYGAGLAVVAILFAAAGMAVEQDRSAPRGLTGRPAVMRLSPHGLSPQVGTVDAFALVPIEASRPGWVRVRDPFGRPGWVEASALTLLRTLD